MPGHLGSTNAMLWRLLLTVVVLVTGTLGREESETPANESETELGNKSPTAPASLLNTMLATMLVVFLGLFSVRAGFISPEKGDMKGMGYIVGTIVFPMLIFRTVALAKFDDIDFGVLLACNLAKILVLTLGFLITYGIYGRRSSADRFLTAVVFGFFTISSNDFAIGFPVINALFGESKYNMDIYLTGNALMNSVFFVPWAMILLSVGTSMKNKENEKHDLEKEASPADAANRWTTVINIIRSPVITMTIMGGLYRLLLGWTLHEDKDGNLAFPDLINSAVSLINSLFACAALFMTGTALKSLSVSFWPLFLVMLKVPACAFFTYGFALVFITGPNEERNSALIDFSYLYGMIPSSTAPLIFAAQFCGWAANDIASAVLWGMILSGPMMFLAAVFLDENTSLTIIDTLAPAELACSFLSVVLITVLIGLTFRYRRLIPFSSCPMKVYLVWLSCFIFVYEILAISMNPNVTQYMCRFWNSNPWFVGTIALGWLQHTIQFMVFMLHLMVIRPDKFPGDFPATRRVIRACMVMALVPALTTIPNTFSEMCSVVPPANRFARLWPNSVWTGITFILFTSTYVYGFWHDPSSHTRPETQIELSKALDEDSSVGTAPLTGVYSKLWQAGHCIPPSTVALGMAGFQVLRVFMQALITTILLFFFEVRGETIDDNSLIQMLTVETVLVHSQGIILCFSIVMSLDFPTHTHEPTHFHESSFYDVAEPAQQQSMYSEANVFQDMAMYKGGQRSATRSHHTGAFASVSSRIFDVDMKDGDMLVQRPRQVTPGNADSSRSVPPGMKLTATKYDRLKSVRSARTARTAKTTRSAKSAFSTSSRRSKKKFAVADPLLGICPVIDSGSDSDDFEGTVPQEPISLVAALGDFLSPRPPQSRRPVRARTKLTSGTDVFIPEAPPVLHGTSAGTLPRSAKTNHTAQMVKEFKISVPELEFCAPVSATDSTMAAIKTCSLEPDRPLMGLEQLEQLMSKEDMSSSPAQETAIQAAAAAAAATARGNIVQPAVAAVEQQTCSVEQPTFHLR